MRRIEPAIEGAERIAGLRPLDLDHVGAEVGQMHAGRRTGDVGPHFDDADVLEYLRHVRSVRPSACPPSRRAPARRS